MNDDRAWIDRAWIERQGFDTSLSYAEDLLHSSSDHQLLDVIPTWEAGAYARRDDATFYITASGDTPEAAWERLRTKIEVVR